MREILFRAITDDSVKPKIWVYGCLNYGTFDGKPFSYSISELDGPSYQIIPETLGQYIGIEDKNSVKIFEGDNIKTSGMSTFEGEVVFHEGSYKCKVLNTYSDPDYFSFIGNQDYDDGRVRFDYELKFEVVGNIHDDIKNIL